MSNKSFVELLLCQPLPSDEVRKQLNQLVEREVAKSKLPERMHRFDVADVVLMQKWLLAIPDVNLLDRKAADLWTDGVLNVFDLCIMKQLLYT